VSAYKTISETRIKGFTQRMGLAAIVCFTAMLLAPSVWPIIWIVVYFLSQLIDNKLFIQCLGFEGPIPKPLQLSLMASVAISVTIFSGMSAYIWFLGGEVGRSFAIVAICGGLLHVSLLLFQVRRLLYCAVVPHALYLLALPVISAVIEHSGASLSLLVLNIGAFVFLANLSMGVKQSYQAMKAQQDAKREALEAQALAEQASAAKSNFLAVMTHEIRTPMNAVVSSANLLKRTDLSPEQREHVSMLSEASDVLLGLVNDVLDISKIEAGKMTTETSPLNLPEMIDVLGRLWTPLAEQKGLRFTIDQEEGLSQTILSDPLRLKQILFNLISNAVKFTSEGEINFKILTQTRENKPWIRFEIHDNGIGVDSSQIDRLFSSFEQAESATTRRYGGTGLGLPISRQLARLMGGDVDVTSALGKGSIFSLTLPYQPVMTSTTSQSSTFDLKLNPPKPLVSNAFHKEPKPMSALSAESKKRILIVDDHEVNRRIVSLFIAPLGWECVMASDGAESVLVTKNQLFDVILMDMQMPVMGGIEATKLIREQAGPNQDTPIIALTANAMDQHKRMWAEVGVHDFLTKPIDPDLLINTLIARAMRLNPEAIKLNA
jgi:two-component system, sensor histidine kinase